MGTDCMLEAVGLLRVWRHGRNRIERREITCQLNEQRNPPLQERGQWTNFHHLRRDDVEDEEDGSPNADERTRQG